MLGAALRYGGIMPSFTDKWSRKMSEIAMYNVLTKLGATPDEAEKAVADVASAKDVATKEYIDAAIARLETRLTWRIVIAIGVAAAVTSAIVKLL